MIDCWHPQRPYLGTVAVGPRKNRAFSHLVATFVSAHVLTFALLFDSRVFPRASVLVVVFSTVLYQFVNMLDLIEYRMHKGQVGCRKLSGHLSVDKRDEASFFM